MPLGFGRASSGMSGGWSPGFQKRPKSPLSFKEAYPAAVEQTGEDYSGIMGGYKSILDKVPGQSGDLMQRYKDILANPSAGASPELQTYNRDPDVTKSLAGLEELSKTGGYSEEDQANLRARGISPIRSVYANAQRNLDRSKTLSGGYSPNSAAASARMARELSEQVSGATQNVNADIAERVAQGRLSAAPQYAQFAGRESDVEKGIDASNIAAQNRFKEIGLGRESEALGGMRSLQDRDIQTSMGALEGMRSLYGTTPALASTFGNQAMGAAQLGEQAKGRTRSSGLGLINQFMQRRGR